MKPAHATLIHALGEFALLQENGRPHSVLLPSLRQGPQQGYPWRCNNQTNQPQYFDLRTPPMVTAAHLPSPSPRCSRLALALWAYTAAAGLLAAGLLGECAQVELTNSSVRMSVSEKGVASLYDMLRDILRTLRFH